MCKGSNPDWLHVLEDDLMLITVQAFLTIISSVRVVVVMLGLIAGRGFMLSRLTRGHHKSLSINLFIWKKY